MENMLAMVDGNEAAARMAYAINEVIAIYPITPASPMGEYADAWSAKKQENCWGTVPTIVEMQSEGGAAGAVHGALQTGALTTTFTASQGLLLMLPNMFKIAGELSPSVFHIASRSVAAQALSIFCDHSDVMAARGTGFSLLSASTVQEVYDFALISQAASLKGRIPIVHFFDGFRTSHEIKKINILPTSFIREFINLTDINAHRSRALSPENPVIRGTSQNPDVFFQARETTNPFYQKFPFIMQAMMNDFAKKTGRQYQLFDYHGVKDAQRVIVLMGSGCDTVEETIDELNKHNEKVGMIKVRLYRPFDSEAFVRAMPVSVKAVAVLDRTKEPGSDGEPLYKDVLTAVTQNYMTDGTRFKELPKISGGRYGLSSKEFTPGMVKAILDTLLKPKPITGFTIGIDDDVTHLSLNWESTYRSKPDASRFQAIFYGLGSDGTVSANKNSIKIIGESSNLHAQGYFVYDSKKAGAVTVSHLRFGQKTIRSAYLIEDGEADFVACHQADLIKRFPILEKAKTGSKFLLNTSLAPEKVWSSIPSKQRQLIIDKNILFYVIDAYAIAQKHGIGKRINTIMQTCFFTISDVLPMSDALSKIKKAIKTTYGKSKRIIDANISAVNATNESLQQVEISDEPVTVEQPSQVANELMESRLPAFWRDVTLEIIKGRGDLIPVSMLPPDGTYPPGTTAIEKRNLATEIPVWETDLCTHCGKCVFVCPHSVIRSKAYKEGYLKNTPNNFKHTQIKGKDFPQDIQITYQVSPEDCTGCGLCVDICPIRDKSQANRKALNMRDKQGIEIQEKNNWLYFLGLPEYERKLVKRNTIKGAMLFESLFEFSSACKGCGETSYLRLASQLFGDRMVIANATGCSSIYGGNLPTTPWSKNKDGRGPAWNNSLFEDNAEFGLGMRIAIDNQKEFAKKLLLNFQDTLNDKLIDEILNANQQTESGIHEQRQRVELLKIALAKSSNTDTKSLIQLAENFIRKSVWIIGGDGWAYDIGYGGLDHVLASGRDVNILILDTEVYSNTGGQTSKATPKGAVAKFSAAGKSSSKKDLAKLAMSYENVYVAQVAYGAKDIQTLHAFIDAESYCGPSIIIAYSPCIAHGVELTQNHRQQKLAVNSGHWPLLRYDPRKIEKGENPLHLDSKVPSIPYSEFASTETRFNVLWHTHPERAHKLLNETQAEVRKRFSHYQQLAQMDWQKGSKRMQTCIKPKGDNHE